MRDYGKIYTSFWDDPDIKNLSDAGSRLAAYLLTSKHTTMLGCFILPIGYIAEDLRWDIDKTKAALSELISINYILRDEMTGWCLIPNFLNWNEIENPNQAKSIIKLLKQIPKKVSFYSKISSLAKAIYYQIKNFKEINALSEQLQLFLNPCETVTEGLQNPFLTVKQRFRNQEQEQEQEQDIKALKNAREKKCVRGVDNFPEVYVTKLNEDFCVTDRHIAYAQFHKLPNPHEHVEKFKNHYLASGAIQENWDNCFQKWLCTARDLEKIGARNGQHQKPLKPNKYDVWAEKNERGLNREREIKTVFGETIES